MLPILFSVGGYAIHSFGVMVALGFIVAMEYSRRAAMVRGYNPVEILDLTFWLMIFGIIGSRILFVLVNWQLFAQQPIEALYVWKGGLVWYGGLIFATGFGMFYMRRKSMPFWETCDLIAPAVMLGLAIGRIGCFAVGDDHGRLVVSALGDIGQRLQEAGLLFDQAGRVTDEARSQIFAHAHQWPWWSLEFSRASLVQDDLADLPLYPTQIVMSLYSFGLFAMLHAFAWYKSRSGQVFFLMAASYALCRFLLEFIRGDLDRGSLMWFSTSQWISLAIAVAAVAVYSRVRNSLPLATNS